MDKVPIPFYMPEDEEEKRRTAVKQQLFERSSELQQASVHLSQAGETSRRDVFELCAKVFVANVFFNHEKWQPDKPTKDMFSDITNNGRCALKLAAAIVPTVLAAGRNALRDIAHAVTVATSGLVRRVINIGRTAIKRAQNYARYISIRLANLFRFPGDPEWGKEWDAITDDRTRDSHKAMDGQIRRVNEYFTTGNGNLMMFPGDTNAPIEEWINCRCNMNRVKLEA